MQRRQCHRRVARPELALGENLLVGQCCDVEAVGCNDGQGARVGAAGIESSPSPKKLACTPTVGAMRCGAVRSLTETVGSSGASFLCGAFSQSGCERGYAALPELRQSLDIGVLEQGIAPEPVSRQLRTLRCAPYCHREVQRKTQWQIWLRVDGQCVDLVTGN